MNWKPFNLIELQEHIGESGQWFLDGGLSLDCFLGYKTRDHGDIDIGVLSENAPQFLNKLIQKGFKIYDATQGLVLVKPSDLQNLSYNYWVADDEYYRLQVLVYNVDNNQVLFRRNPGIRWPLEHFILSKGNIRLANPLVVYAFKVTTQSVAPKDQMDINHLFHFMETLCNSRN